MAEKENQAASAQRRGANAGCLSAVVMIVLAIAYWPSIRELDWYWQLGLAWLALIALSQIYLVAGKSRAQLQVTGVEALFKAGRYPEALEQAEAVIATNPSNAEAHYIKGQCLDRLGRTAEADAAWQEALKHNPSHAGAAHDLACDLMDRGDLVSAADYFANADRGGAKLVEPEAFQTNTELLKNRLHAAGQEAERRGDWQEALRISDAMLKVFPEWFLAHAWRAHHQLMLGHFAEAIEDAKACLRIDPSYQKARWIIEEAEDLINADLAKEQLPGTGSAQSGSEHGRESLDQFVDSAPPDVATLLKPREPGSGASSDSHKEEDSALLWQPGDPAFERLEIREIVDTGGMATVYYAVDKDSGFPVVLKAVKATTGTKEGSKLAALFRSEAEHWFRLGEHPNIVRLYTVETYRHRELVLAMEYIAGTPGIGPTLAHHLEDKFRLEAEEACRVAVDICRAMEYAFATSKLVHRDLKPSNVFVTTTGRAKVGDFGLAAVVGTKADGWGTPAYMAPEQGDEPVAVEMDIYSTGVILYEMLTGELPGLDADNGPLLRERGVPKRLAAVVLRCLAEDPAARFHGFADLRKMLSPFVGETEVDDSPRERRVTGPSGAAIQAEREAMRAYQSGISLDSQGRFEEALAAYRTAVKHEPFKSRQSEAWCNMGKVLGQLRRWEEALRAFERALEINAHDLHAQHGLAMTLTQLGRRNEAVERFDQLIAADPGRVESFIGKAVLLHEMGDIEGATAAYSRARSIDANHPYVWNGLGLCAEAAGDLDLALEMFDHAIEARVTFADPHVNRARLLETLRRTEGVPKAVHQAREAVRLEPENSELHVALAYAFASLGRYEEAAVLHMEWRFREYRDPVDKRRRIVAMLVQCEERDAMLETGRRMPTSPHDEAMCHLYQGLISAGHQRFEEAVGLLEKSLELEPANGMTCLALAPTYFALGRYQDAERLGMRAAELGEPIGEDVARSARESMK